MKKSALLMCAMLMLFVANGCGGGGFETTSESDSKNIRLRIDDTLVSVRWENNDSTRELKKLLQDKDLP